MSEVKDDPVASEYKEWLAVCRVCDACYTLESNDTEPPGPTFCPDCRDAGKRAPGVLNWRMRRPHTHTGARQ